MHRVLPLVVVVVLGAPDASTPDASSPVLDGGLLTTAIAADAVVAATAEALRAEQIARAEAAIERMQKAAAAVTDLTVKFHKKEMKKGSWLPEELIELKVRRSPHSVYMKWIGDNYRGQELIWRKGWNGNEAHVHTNTFPDFAVDVRPESWLAMRRTRHPVPQAGFDYTVEQFVKDMGISHARPECLKSVEDKGPEEVFGAPSHCYEMELYKDRCPYLYSYKARLCLHNELGLPTRVEIWDKEAGEIQQVEDYGYEDIQIDIGLTDTDFDPKNKSYKF